MVAILAGMAAAATFVLLQTLHTLNAPIRALDPRPATPAKRPSAFGAVLNSNTPPDAKLSPPQIAKAGNRSIVTVYGYDQNDQQVSQGVGYVYSSSGIIVTTYGAIRGANSVTIDSSTGDELNVIAVMGYNTRTDLAVLAVLEGNLPALESGAAEIVQEGDPVVVVGPNNQVSQGAIGSRRAIGGVDLMQINAPATAGSPVLNDHAKVIAMATNRQLAIPTRYISDLLAEHRVLSFAQILEETQQP